MEILMRGNKTFYILEKIEGSYFSGKLARNNDDILFLTNYNFSMECDIKYIKECVDSLEERVKKSVLHLSDFYSSVYLEEVKSIYSKMISYDRDIKIDNLLNKDNFNIILAC